MTLDIVARAANKADLRNFANNRGLRVDSTDIDGNPIKVDRPGFEYTWWAGTGQFLTAKRQLRATQTVGQADATEFAFQGPSPAWISTDVTAERGETIVGNYTRRQGQWNIFTLAAGETATVGEDLDIYTPNEFLPGVVVIMRFSGAVEAEDTIADPVDAESWSKSQIAKAIRDNGTPVSYAGGAITGFAWDGVELFRYQDVAAWLSSQGLPTHGWAGGNHF